MTETASTAWLQAHLLTDKEQAQRAEDLLQRLGALSVTLTDAADEPLLEPAPGETPLWRATRVTALFDGDIDSDMLRLAISAGLGAEPGSGLTLERLADQAWERSWLDHFQPMQFGERLWIQPSGKRVVAPGAVTVDLDPGLAFGTGTHPTTALCLRWLDSADLSGRTVIDYGCGSGVLGIAALKLGAKRVIAVDHDPQALTATHDNAKRNGVTSRLTVLDHRATIGQRADIVIANILAGIIVELAPTLTSLLKPHGQLVLSGLLRNQCNQVRGAFPAELSFAEPSHSEDWSLLTATLV